jgi:hypothetical protein
VQPDFSHDSSVTALQIEESSLLHICQALTADTIEVDGTRVTFIKVLPTSDRQLWSGEYGEWVVRDGRTWTVQPGPRPLTWVRTA